MNRNSHRLSLIIALLMAQSLVYASEIYCDDNPENLETYLNMHEVLFMQRDESRVAEFYAPEVISHNQDAGGGDLVPVRHEELQAMWVNSRKTSPDRVLINNLILCMGDFVVARVTFQGTRLGPLPGLEPGEEGRPYKASGIDIYRFEDGKVVERWGNNDGVTLMRQLGLLKE
jgi:predicted ester cyclase